MDVSSSHGALVIKEAINTRIWSIPILWAVDSNLEFLRTPYSNYTALRQSLLTSLAR